ncbi:hypothetical protein K435DRAFT_869949 [Dendrothele bispora CBS 962.96]|uniref:Uncharacterized protein n=1 Tax=Dendrothele bispora (strain CBS 962.96) TaxID=1314807 RepID=A0A4S8L7V0_DENBC|nr:hypothetical protein K435DRAFT_869949 [Dendrothele bispora CBS 962.96]
MTGGICCLRWKHGVPAHSQEEIGQKYDQNITVPAPDTFLSLALLPSSKFCFRSLLNEESD